MPPVCSGGAAIVRSRALKTGSTRTGWQAAGAAWPPAGARALETELLYERLADAGYDYGPCFQGLACAWRAGDAIYAEVQIESEQLADTAGFGVHPAVFDSMLHVALAIALDDRHDEELEVPSAFSGVRLLGSAAGALRVRIGRSENGGAWSLLAFDRHGALRRFRCGRSRCGPSTEPSCGSPGRPATMLSTSSAGWSSRTRPSTAPGREWWRSAGPRTSGRQASSWCARRICRGSRTRSRAACRRRSSC